MGALRYQHARSGPGELAWLAPDSRPSADHESDGGMHQATAVLYRGSWCLGCNVLTLRFCSALAGALLVLWWYPHGWWCNQPSQWNATAPQGTVSCFIQTFPSLLEQCSIIDEDNRPYNAACLSSLAGTSWVGLQPTVHSAMAVSFIWGASEPKVAKSPSGSSPGFACC